jgi:hypothetical protein
VGIGKTVTGDVISLSGTDAANYTFNQETTTTANISPLALLVSATGEDRVYDGSTAATVTLSDNRIAGDVILTDYLNDSFDNADVGQNKPISVIDIKMSGRDAINYINNTTATTTASITTSSIIVPDIVVPDIVVPDVVVPDVVVPEVIAPDVLPQEVLSPTILTAIDSVLESPVIPLITNSPFQTTAPQNQQFSDISASPIDFSGTAETGTSLAPTNENKDE